MEGKPLVSCALIEIEFLYDTNGTYLRVPLKIQIFRHSREGGNPQAIDSSGIPKSLDSRLRGNDEFLEAP
jgi:hypothetical protein